MRELEFGTAIDDALAQAMADDDRIVVFGEDVHALRMNLYARFGSTRVRPTPISESAFLGAAVGAAMAGLRPVVEIMIIDFIAVAADALVNQAAKIESFSGGRWTVPMVVRSACGGGYGDGGQHEQALWGWLAHVPGLCVVVPSTPGDAGRLLLGALRHPGPTIYLEHKLLSDTWRDYLGSGGRGSVAYDVPPAGNRGPVPERWEPLPLGQAATRRHGDTLTIISLGVGVHRAMAAAAVLATEGISAEVIDLRTLQPLDATTVVEAVGRTGRVLVVDEDYEKYGLSGEIAAVLLEAGLRPGFARVCVQDTIPYDPKRELSALPNQNRIVSAARRLASDAAGPPHLARA